LGGSSLKAGTEMIYALVHYPSIDFGRINQFRKKYDPQFELIEPHITIMFPVPESVGEEKLVHHFASVLDGWNSFPIHLQGCQISSDDYVFLLIQEGHANIIHLHDEAYTGIVADYWRKDIPFVPHLTLGVLNKNSTNFHEVLQEAEELSSIDYYCILDRLHLVKVKDDRSKIVWSKEFLLSK
jgi:2'-5' RNA ligase